MSERTVTVEFDPKLHPSVKFDDLDGPSKLAFAALDTAYNLLREYAVRVTLAAVRDELSATGQEMPSDEEIFKMARESGVEGAPTSYMDLAPLVSPAALSLHDAFELLVVVATGEAIEGMLGGQN